MIDIAYVAGVIDARGHVEPDRSRVRVTTKRSDLVQWLADRTGTSPRHDVRGYHRRACSEHCQEKHTEVVRQSSYWSVAGLTAVVILYDTLPWLVSTRYEALDLLRRFTLPRFELVRTATGAELHRLGWPLPSRDDLKILIEQG